MRGYHLDLRTPPHPLAPLKRGSRPLPLGEVVGAWRRGLAGGTPRFKEGARAPNDRHPIASAGSLLAPAAVFYAGRGRGHMREAGLLVPPGCCLSRAHVVRGTFGGCALSTEIRVGAPLATGCRAGRHGGAMLRMDAGVAQPRVTCPGHLRELPRGRCDERSRTASSRAPALPRVGAQACRVPYVGRVRGSVGEVGGAGISLVVGV